jgi:hypothetical protein
MKPGRASGTATLKKASSGEARRVAAASSGRSPMASKAFCKRLHHEGQGIEHRGHHQAGEGERAASPCPRAWVKRPTGPLGPITTSR